MAKIRQFVLSRGWGALLICVMLASTFLGPLDLISHFYQPSLFVCILSYFTKLHQARIGWAELLLVLVAALSITLNTPLPVFNSWMRLGLFLLVLLVTSPLLQSFSIDLFRIQLFNWTSLICVVTGVASLFAYYIGINYMQSSYGIHEVHLGGSFGGFTLHSMLLGPIAALGMLRCLYIIINRLLQGERMPYLICFYAMACLISILCASSRGAALAALIAISYLLFSQGKRIMGKIIRFSLCFICFSLPLVPTLSHFSSGLISKQEANIKSGGTFYSRTELWNDRLNEFQSSPVYGVGFASQKIIRTKATQLTGVIEPGSSYGAVFAMTGVLGGVVFLCILFGAIFPKRKESPSLPQIYLVFFAIHMLIEGYIFAGGSPLCFIFWLCIGAACAIKQDSKLQNLIV